MIGEPESRNYKPLIGIAGAVVVIAAGVWYYFHSRHAPPPPPPAAPATAEQPQEPAIQHPLPAGGAANSGPLPALNDSDASLKDALDPVLGTSAIKDYLVPENIVRRLVVTIDNLPRQKVAVQKRPVNPVAGAFEAEGDEQHATLDARNFARYRPLVGVIANLDVHQLVAVYQHFYPLFQQSYQDLGYPNGYFNDRLVQAIDSLLATPKPQGSIELTRPNVMYVFADPALEALPAGQKLLLRMGPENAAVIKSKLTELRAAVTALPPPKK
jgi:hypothetical protein